MFLVNLAIITFLPALLEATNHKYTIIELRHDCSGNDSILERQLWTSVVFRLKEPLFEQCRGKRNLTSFSWRFNMIRNQPCRGLIGCHNIESRFDPWTKKQVYDIEVFAEKWKNEQIIEETRIHNKGNRQYWNLAKSDESIGIRVNFDPQALETSKDTLPKMMCFAWCNSEMLDTAPLKETHRVAMKAMNKLVESIEKIPKGQVQQCENETDVITSPVKVYKLGENLNNYQCNPDTQICSTKLTFEWLNPEAVCESSFLCTQLYGAICQEYGVIVSHLSKEGMTIKNETVCESNVVHEGTIGAGQRAVVTFWHHELYFGYQSECFFWCTKNGQIPKVAATNPKYILPHKVEDYQWHQIILGETEEEYSMNLSPMMMYNVSIASDGLKTRSCSGDICWSKITLKKQYKQACSGKFVCQNLDKNICGNYGIILTVNSKKLSPCHPNEVIEFQNLEKNDPIEVEHWHHHLGQNDVPSNLHCYLWCSASGMEPGLKGPNQHIDKTLAAMHARPLKTNQGLSPFIAYNINESCVKKQCNQERCVDIFTLNWHHDTTCIVGAVCPRMTGNICGDFVPGIGIRNVSNYKTETLCIQGEIVQNFVGPNGKLLFYVYLMRDFSQFTFDCYVWCTYDGKMPHKTIKQISNNSTMVAKDTILSYFENDLNMSPTKVYEFKRKSKPCSTIKCKETLDFNWNLFDEPCMFHFTCTKLTGHICGDYGIKLMINEDVSTVCETNVTTSVPLQGTGRLEYWYTHWDEEDLHEIVCYAWCQPSEDFVAVAKKDFEITPIKINGSQIRDIPITKTHWIIASPQVVYHLYDANIGCKASQICDRSLTFLWKKDYACKSTLVCPKLGQDVCGTFVMWLNREDPICSENVSHYSVMNPLEDRVDINLSVLRGQTPDFECYFWCTLDGKVPLQPTVSGSDILRSAKNHPEIETTSKLVDVPIEITTTLALSPFNYYNLWMGTNCMKSEVCYWTVDLQQHILFKPYINLYCKHLGAEVCGGFEFQIGTESICFKEHAYSFENVESVTIKSYKWIRADIDCILWTSDQPSVQIENVPKGNPPQKKFNDSTDIDFSHSYPLSPVQTYRFSVDFKDLNGCFNDTCVANMYFNWHWEDSCTASIFCPEMTHNTCGDYGLNLLTDHSYPICHEDLLYQTDLTDQATINLWYVPGAVFGLQCYFWCNNSLAAKFWNSSYDAEILIKVEKRTKHLLNMEPVQETNTSIGLSPVRLYHLDSNSDTWNCKGSEKCFHNFMFHWHGDEPCQLNVICSHLGSHICADHGLVLQNDQQQNICHTDEIYETYISRKSTLNVRLWHMYNANVNISCYFWCRDTHNRYNFDHQPKMNVNTEDLSLANMVLSDVPLSTPLSGKYIYLLELNQTSNQKCKTEICKKSLVYDWHAPYDCQAAFYCTALTGNICGDYGIEMVQGSNKHYICHPGQHYNVTLNLTDSLTINFWYTEDNLNFDVACYFWCLEPLFPQSNFTSIQPLKTSEHAKFANSSASATFLELEDNTTHEVFEQSNEVCNGDLCTMHANYVWLGSSKCELAMMCSSLTGNICSLSGLYMDIHNDTIPLCFENKLFHGQLETHETLNLTLWKTSLANYKIHCKFWCNTKAESLIDAADYRTLHFTSQLLTNDDCNNGLCVVKQKFHLNREEPCLATFQCSHLDQDACTTYGLNITFPDSQDSRTVCQRKAVLVGKLHHNQSLLVDVWYLQGVSIQNKASCHIWCANKFTHKIHQNKIPSSPEHRKVIEADSKAIEFLTSETMYQVKISKGTMPLHYTFKISSKLCLVSNVQCFELKQGCSEGGVGLIYQMRKVEIRQKICKSHKIYQQRHPLGGSITFKAWISSSHGNNDFTCNVWCTKS